MLRPSLPRKCKAPRSVASKATRSVVGTAPKTRQNGARPTKRGASNSSKKAPHRDVMEEEPTVSQPPPPPGTTNNERSSIMNPGWGTQHGSGEAPARRHAKDEYKSPALGHFSKLLAFHDEGHIEFVEERWVDFQSSILMLARRGCVETVSWETLGSETQDMLKVWAPKAKEYLETREGAKVIFEGWLWRILVNDIFNGPGEQQHWKVYTDLQRMIEPLAAMTPDQVTDYQLDRHLKKGEWRQVMADTLKDRYLLWRALTMDLVRALHKQEARYTVEYVAGLLNRKLGSYFQPEIHRRTWDDLQKNVDELARRAVALDWHMHCSTTKWDFGFTDPETGTAHGFVYKKSHFIEPHVVSADEAGYPVDLVVRPLVLSQGDFLGPEMGN
ncbi:hypothetical protein C8A01DRAFT_39732 [Parachaetomium inaequale]|uniref:Uncharacterized protein n=1 Tax=Parachaetomium inaequale TaxID=2588326 RepID=A0AAN6PBK6_9PEZI|nr:hypothetical protein C8A01DRAFT_39732 [Parachaetomium inaequale]